MEREYEPVDSVADCDDEGGAVEVAAALIVVQHETPGEQDEAGHEHVAVKEHLEVEAAHVRVHLATIAEIRDDVPCRTNGNFSEHNTPSDIAFP